MASSGMINVKMGLVVALVCGIIMGGRVSEAAVTCNQVVSYLGACVSYVTGGGTPSATCCSGVQDLNKLASTAADRQAVCGCLESLVKGVSYNAQTLANAAALPAKCGVKLPYKIDPRTDCSTIR
ncbi:hypothetical protein SDJN02_11548, partial [Cucurbita argyrosperma subsp. argyrosperma]